MEEISMRLVFICASFFVVLMFVLVWINSSIVRNRYCRWLDSVCDTKGVVDRVPNELNDTHAAVSESYLYDDFWSPRCPENFYLCNGIVFSVYFNHGASMPGFQGTACVIIRLCGTHLLDGYAYKRSINSKYTTRENLPPVQFDKNEWIGKIGNKYTGNILSTFFDLESKLNVVREVSLRGHCICIRTSSIGAFDEIVAVYMFVSDLIGRLAVSNPGVMK